MLVLCCVVDHEQRIQNDVPTTGNKGRVGGQAPAAVGRVGSGIGVNLAIPLQDLGFIT